MADFVSGDTGSTLLLTCADDAGAAIDLTGCTIKLRWQEAAGTIADKTMTIVSAAAGTCSYKFLAGELYPPAMAFEVKITDAGGFILKNVHLITVTVRDDL
ncbi:hypothetical protein SAMN05216420_101396 [Nitrosospira sp. Nl5]|uniref:hypothetical protein n=1 Tax=Nitrosospira sp. Nl5 TaxID=200120 RepID=UPI000881AE12|nr:hypothetical protein [Nitrosospira sp. Nl5]SCX94107.1 hypothetical protein SAMN05216420_101396 [Nitrosospira sp. Nl5]